MKVYYISPSSIPSRSANLIHVLFMCEAMTESGHNVNLFIHSNKYSSGQCLESLKDSYDFDNNKLKIFPFKANLSRGKELSIACYALLIFVLDLFKGDSPDLIISRNIYGAFFLGIFLRRKLIYETHAPEKGFRKYLQESIISSKKIDTVVISNALKKIILQNKKILGDKVHVFHDAAKAGRICLDASQRNILKTEFLSSISNKNNYENIIGYFGHLYPGRGIEIIQELAKKHPKNAFIVYGGNDHEIEKFINSNISENLFFMGHLNQNSIYKKMSMMDILLMPYQNQVSIGLDSVDTSLWMSPMKMFEYMSASVPIISSNLPVLTEVLVDNSNCLLVKSDDVVAWSNAIDKVLKSTLLQKKLRESSYNDYLNKYTWTIRAKKILDL